MAGIGMTTPTLIDGRALLAKIEHEKEGLELLKVRLRRNTPDRLAVCRRVMQLEVVIGWVKQALIEAGDHPG